MLINLKFIVNGTVACLPDSIGSSVDLSVHFVLLLASSLEPCLVFVTLNVTTFILLDAITLVANVGE